MTQTHPVGGAASGRWLEKTRQRLRWVGQVAFEFDPALVTWAC